MRTITVVNKCTVLTSAQVQAAVDAVALQLADNFCPSYGLGTIDLVVGDDTGANETVTILNTTDQAGALGYHEDAAGRPQGFVFAQTTIEAGDHWEATLSHEVLEQAADPFCNTIALGVIRGRAAGIAYEVCDPVENDEYEINGVPVSNFVLPAWFFGASGHVDFLGKLPAGFAMSPSGYIAYTPNLRGWAQIFGDKTPAHQREATRYSRRSRRNRRGVPPQSHAEAVKLANDLRTEAGLPLLAAGPTFTPGQKVALNGGGPTMTVDYIGNAGVVCQWFNGAGDLQAGTFLATSLTGQ